MSGRRLFVPLLGLLLAGLLAACATTPVTGRSQLLLISEEYAIATSEPAYFKLLSGPAKEGRLDRDPVLKARVQRIAGRLVYQAIRLRPETARWKWSIHVIDDPETVNAWAMAGGRMALYSGLVKKLSPSDDELAQVLGHEIAHALARHTAEKMSVALATDLAVTAWAVKENKDRTALAGAALAAALAVKLPNSRQAEAEADRIGVELAARAGYDPRAAVSLWQKMSRLDKGRVPEFLSTHPSDESRIEALQELVPQMMPVYRAPGERGAYQFRPEAEALPGS